MRYTVWQQHELREVTCNNNDMKIFPTHIYSNSGLIWGQFSQIWLNTMISIWGNMSENVDCKMAATLSRPQCVIAGCLSNWGPWILMSLPHSWSVSQSLCDTLQPIWYAKGSLQQLTIAIYAGNISFIWNFCPAKASRHTILCHSKSNPGHILLLAWDVEKIYILYFQCLHVTCHDVTMFTKDTHMIK